MPQPMQCPGCAMIATLSKGLPDGGGHYIGLVPNPEVR